MIIIVVVVICFPLLLLLWFFSNKHLSINNTWAWDETSFSKINIKCYSSALSLSIYIYIYTRIDVYEFIGFMFALNSELNEARVRMILFSTTYIWRTHKNYLTTAADRLQNAQRRIRRRRRRRKNSTARICIFAVCLDYFV